MLNRILKGIAVFAIVAALTISGLSLTNEKVSAAEGDLAETSEETNDNGYAFGRGMRNMMRKAEDLDGDGYPDLPEGVTRPCDTDGDGVPDNLPEGVTPRWDRDRVRDPEVEGEGFGREFGMGMRNMMRKAENPFRGRVCQNTAATETP
ncbi:MAG: hypothetical protein PHR78_03170 [Eubacteriales bacterium]|nr:hypothetical protein [Eubacteriales bacterium]MDD4324335.1 hypothetical protein [Eubacteriales bacterium]MDD4541154.1 hypothetical protein [Eubacteriales bacterium]